MPLAKLFVVRLEKMTERQIELPVSGNIGLQHHGFKEPARVREMPLRRARLRHELHSGVGIRQTCRQCLGRSAYMTKEGL